MGSCVSTGDGATIVTTSRPPPDPTAGSSPPPDDEAVVKEVLTESTPAKPPGLSPSSPPLKHDGAGKPKGSAEEWEICSAVEEKKKRGSGEVAEEEENGSRRSPFFPKIWRKRSLSEDFHPKTDQLFASGCKGEAGMSSPGARSLPGREGGSGRRTASLGNGVSRFLSEGGLGRPPVPGKASLENTPVSLECFIFL